MIPLLAPEHGKQDETATSATTRRVNLEKEHRTVWDKQRSRIRSWFAPLFSIVSKCMLFMITVLKLKISLKMRINDILGSPKNNVDILGIA